MDSPSRPPMTMDGQLSFFEDPVQLAHQLAMSQLECTALKRERDLLQHELTAAREEVSQLLRVLQKITDPPTRRGPSSYTGEQPLWRRIMHYLETSDRPKRAWQVRDALKLHKSPQRELARLVERGLAIRVRPGVFSAPGSEDTESDLPAPVGGVNPASLRQRIIALVQQADRPLRSPEIQAALHASRPIRQELSKLVNEGKLERVTAGRYIAPKATQTS